MSFYAKIEKWFERLTDVALKVYGSSITFLIAFSLVLIYLFNKKFYNQDFHDIIRDIILCLTFLSFFMLQKWYNKLSYSLHIKMNELLATHDKASNRIVNIEEKTEAELRELSKHYGDLAEKAIIAEDIHEPKSIETILAEKQARKK